MKRYLFITYAVLIANTPGTTHSYFEFRPGPSLMDVLFDDFRL
jgi:hypothetical protein